MRADGTSAGQRREALRGGSSSGTKPQRPPRKQGFAGPPDDVPLSREGRKPGPERKPATPRMRADGTSAGEQREAFRGGSSSGAKPQRPPRKQEPNRKPDADPVPGAGRKKRPEPKRAAPRIRADGTAAGEPREIHRDGEPQRIAKLLARAGIASRREIERMIADRRIAIDGAVVETPATILTSLKGVSVDGKPVRPAAETRLFLYHKPAGLLTAERDFSGRPTIYDRLKPALGAAAGGAEGDLPRLMPVGRLDLNTEGLLLLTNDGEFKRQLELPATGIERTYRARVFGEVTQDQLEGLIQGVEIEGVRYGPIDANMERRTGRNFWVEMRLREGKNREVRRVLEHFELQVSRLIRIAYGPFVLGDLRAGEVAEVRQHDLVEFRKTLK
jgi:23S rRNA pseudouridine2605 synthase